MSAAITMGTTSGVIHTHSMKHLSGQGGSLVQDCEGEGGIAHLPLHPISNGILRSDCYTNHIRINVLCGLFKEEWGGGGRRESVVVGV